MKIDADIQFLYIDLFCGAGGTSTGVEDARINNDKCAKVIACVNHDSNAIASHAENHPESLHFTEDIRILDLTMLCECIRLNRIKYSNAKIVLWASLECTNFSKAKGGMARDADSRTLAEHLFRYIDALKPDYIQIENVEEFMSWGDLDEKGKPISSTNGKHYRRWINDVKKYGYDFDYRILNAADFGAYTSRKRFFGIFAKNNLPIAWPKQTHSKSGAKDLFSSLSKWKPVKDCLDFTDEGESIFGRKKPLVEATLDRIYSGLIKFVAGGKDKFLLKYNSMGRTGKYNAPGIEEPCPTISTQGRLQICNVNFLSKHFSGHPDSKNISVDGPAHTITAIDHHSLVKANFITKYYSGNPNQMVSGVDDPAATLRTKDSQSLISTSFLSAYYGNGHNHSLNSPSPVVTTKDRLAFVNPKFLCSYNYKDEPKDLNSPCPTVLTKDRFSLVSPQYFIDLQYGNGTPSSIDKPATTLTTNPKHKLVQCDNWLMNTNFKNVGSSVNEPSPVITANRKWHYLMNPQFKSKGGNVNMPCFTLIARMDKMPPYLIEATNDAHHIPSFIKIIDNSIIYEIYEDDTLKMKKIKEFMALYGILDIKMRMLRIPELKMIMGFPKDYVLIGTQAEQKKYIGNAVEVNMARVICEANAKKLIKLEMAV
ncbi:DNA (cytosine-5)-methyltransferase 1 [Dysgonomonas alginatilytica]|uniref:DNA (cytosine-5-)-methyltransferase n=1 Tax=Dysgonomonas alginatilytica TaxID=1605892 RepID=A0A2V3PLZ1_9BACT|nr:DNA cytosine methyltransferase [Dysgonomonas alginatilytica]PXV61204.1 DNA (cytosine-5)-methyltransferase 1 [Dysgonomonas alginatilytica]